MRWLGGIEDGDDLQEDLRQALSRPLGAVTWQDDVWRDLEDDAEFADHRAAKRQNPTFLLAVARRDTRQQIVQIFTSSAEYRSNLVTEDYLTYLHRLPAPAEPGPFVQLLANGDTAEEVAVIIVGSPEYFQKRGGGTSDGFLKALYPDLLNRPIDPSGEAAWLRFLAEGHTRQQVAEAIFASPEYLQDLVNGLYPRFLYRPADPTGLAALVSALGHGARDEDIIAAILSSTEYFTRP